MPKSLLKQFIDIFSGPDDDINLAEAALLIARQEYPYLDIDFYLTRIDEMAGEISTRLGAEASALDIIQTINHFLFKEEGYAGNIDNYMDPRNSFLNDVIDRKLGIPISLSVLYIEVGHRLGIPFQGVSFPGHFLVKLNVEMGGIIIDPFFSGVSLSQEDLESRMVAFDTEDKWTGSTPLPKFLDTAGNREILARMLRNLKAIYMKSGDYSKALNTAEQLLLVMPDDVNEIRDRGRFYQELECFRAAAADYQTYLHRVPNADDAVDVRARLIDMHRAVAHLN